MNEVEELVLLSVLGLEGGSSGIWTAVMKMAIMPKTKPAAA